MGDSTNILDLPTDPVNVAANNVSLDQSTINQLIDGLKHASQSGSTQLSSRDISMDNTHITTDPQVMPNYVPPSHVPDYIKNEEQDQYRDIVGNYTKNMNRSNSLDDMYNEIQMPLLLSVLYFLFQLPFFKKLLFNYIPFLFASDGNYNIHGFLFTSSLFGMMFYLLSAMTH